MRDNKNGINKIVVMGAGAVGGYFGGRLLFSDVNDVFFIARGEHLKALQKKGLTVRSIDGDFNYWVRASDQISDYKDKTDLILFTVKSYDTDSAVKQIKPIASDSTQILTIQNGLENYDKLVDAFGAERVIRGICRVGAMVVEPGLINHTSLGDIVIGESDGSTSKRLSFVKKLFDEVNVKCTISEDIDKAVWIKFAQNAIFNMVTVIAEVTVDKLFENENTVHLCNAMYDEIALLAERYKIHFTEQDYRNIMEKTKELGAFKTSTYQDRLRGKPLEYETFTGAILRMAKERNVTLPYNESIYGILKLLS